MASGILIVDKPADWTSQDVAAKLRGVFHEKRVGHGGTLDPMATGVLPVFVGRATRAVPFFEHADKEYLAELRLGVVTDTQDSTGRILEEHPVNVTREQLEAVLPRFRGEIEQLPPMYSAVRVNGQRLYALARQGKEIERQPRHITIHSLEINTGDANTGDGSLCCFATQRTVPCVACVALRIHCSKGTYIRTLCHDVGQALGCGGCMSGLVRTRAGAYTLAQAHTMDEILAVKDPAALLLPVDSLFADRPRCAVAAAAEKKLRNGMPLRARSLKDGEYRVYGETGEFLMLGAVRGGELRTVKSFFEIDDQ